MVTQATSPSLTPEVYASIAKTLASVFTVVRPYVTYVRSYNGLWGFVSASDKVDPAGMDSEEVERLISERIRGELRFYDAETHRWLFTLPKPLRDVLRKGRVATDKEPITVPV
jgi:spermidine synthase